ncbi:MAG: hypothetical protein ORN58_05190, partial [Sediminibacterium sp.]|nr:hypothetical protein [Sediminibacterium sp.]
KEIYTNGESEEITLTGKLVRNPTSGGYGTFPVRNMTLTLRSNDPFVWYLPVYLYNHDIGRYLARTITYTSYASATFATDIEGNFSFTLNKRLLQNSTGGFTLEANFLPGGVGHTAIILTDENSSPISLLYRDIQLDTNILKNSTLYNIGNLAITADGEMGRNAYFDFVFEAYRGASDYIIYTQYKPNNLTRPIIRAYETGGVVIQCINRYDRSNFSAQRIAEGGPAVHLFNRGVNLDTYSTVIHEIAHYNHYVQGGANFWYADAIIKESYATGITYYLLNYKLNNEELARNFTPKIRRMYTGIFEDLIDASTSRLVPSNLYYPGNSPYDEVQNYELTYTDNTSNYNANEIEQAFLNSRTWEDLRQRVLNINNPTRCNVNNAFNYWNSSTSFTQDINSCIISTNPTIPSNPPNPPPPELDAAFCYINPTTNRKECL